MSELDRDAGHDGVQAPPPAHTVGARLRRAREAAGLSLADIAAQTKIAERHLQAIEADRFADLASRTYAVGFSRSFARTLGLPEREIADAVRAQLDTSDVWDAPKAAVFEPGDPARVPPSRVAWLAGLGALAAIAVVFALWRSYYDPAVSLPDLTSEEPAAEVSSAPASQAAAPAATPVGGEVVFTALEAGVWVKFYDAAGQQLMQKQMAQGERYVVPADVQGPMLWTARPDALAISVGGRAVPPLAAVQTTMKDVPVTASALLARQPAPAPAAAPAEALGQAAPRAAEPARPAPRPVRTAPVAANPAPLLSGTMTEPSTVSE